MSDLPTLSHADIYHTPEASAFRRDSHMAEVVRRLASLMREADHAFEEAGGSTRHYVRDWLVPLLDKYGLAIVLTMPHGDCDAKHAPAYGAERRE